MSMRQHSLHHCLPRTLVPALLLAVFCSCGQEAAGPTAPRPHRLLPLAGDGQTAAPGGQLANPLVVGVFDSGNLPLEGIEVSFNVELGSGTITPQIAVTGANGTASARWTLGGTGEQRATASVARSRADPLHAVFVATAIVPSNRAPSAPAQRAAGRTARGRTD